MKVIVRNSTLVFQDKNVGAAIYGATTGATSQYVSIPLPSRYNKDYSYEVEFTNNLASAKVDFLGNNNIDTQQTSSSVTVSTGGSGTYYLTYLGTTLEPYPSLSVGSKHTILLENGNIKIDGTDYAISEDNGNHYVYRLGLFMRGSTITDNAVGAATVHSVKIYHNAEVIANIVAWKDASNVVCFRDIVSNTNYYPNTGTLTEVLQ